MKNIRLFRLVVFLTLALVFASGLHSSPAQAANASRIFAQVKNSAVVVYCFSGGAQPSAYGSGFLVAPNLVATNYHVISQASSVKLKIFSGEIVNASIAKTDQQHDLALLRVEGSGPPLTLAAGIPKVGAEVIAIGNPQGLEWTLSTGVVSGIRVKGENFRLYQITAPISPGSSGGPIMNARGEVMGVATMYMLNGQNLNFAVPSSYIMELLGKGGGGGTHAKPQSEIKSWVDEDGVLHIEQAN